MDHRFKKFLAVAEAGSFSAAARQLHVTQPAITLAIASLEHAYGVRLCLRHRQAVELTREGQLVANTAKKLAQEMEKMEQELLGPGSLPTGQVGIIDSIAHLLYQSSRQDEALNNVEVMVDNSKRILEHLTTDRIDAGVITGQPNALGKGVTVRKLRSEAFVFVCAPALWLAGRATHIDNWLAINQDSTTYEHFVKVFRRLNLTVTPIFYSTSMELLREMAVAGKGTALLPRHMVRHELANGTLMIVKTRKLSRPIWVVVRRRQAPHVLSNLSSRVNKLLAEQ